MLGLMNEADVDKVTASMRTNATQVLMPAEQLYRNAPKLSAPPAAKTTRAPPAAKK